MTARAKVAAGALAVAFMARLPGASNPRSKVYKPFSDLVALDAERTRFADALRLIASGRLDTGTGATDALMRCQDVAGRSPAGEVVRRAWDDARFRRVRCARRWERFGWTCLAAAVVALAWLASIMFSAPLP